MFHNGQGGQRKQDLVARKQDRGQDLGARRQDREIYNGKEPRSWPYGGPVGRGYEQRFESKNEYEQESESKIAYGPRAKLRTV